MSQKSIQLLVLTLFFGSCQNNNYYQNNQAISPSGWATGHTVYFYDSLATADPENLHFEVNLRHNNLYPYQNIWLYIETRCSDGVTRLDSIDWKLAEPNGHWLGSGWGSLYNISYRLPDLRIHKTAKKRWFYIKIQHGLRDDVIQGVEDVGIRLF